MGGIPTLGKYIKASELSRQSMVHSDLVGVWETPASGSETHTLLSSREGAPYPWHGSLLRLGPLPPRLCPCSLLWAPGSRTASGTISRVYQRVPSSAQLTLTFLLFLILRCLPPNPNNLMTNYPTAKLNWLLHQIPWIIGKGKYIAH